MNALTEVQALVLKLILQRMRDWGMPPTHREIAAHFHWASNAAAKCHLLALQKKGLIHVADDMARGIFLLPAGEAFRDANVIDPIGPHPTSPEFKRWYRALMGKVYVPPASRAKWEAPTVTQLHERPAVFRDFDSRRSVPDTLSIGAARK